MTFHDEVHHNEETASYKAVKQLLLWIQTLAPLSNPLSWELKQDLLRVCEEMEWPVDKDEQGIWLLP